MWDRTVEWLCFFSMYLAVGSRASRASFPGTVNGYVCKLVRLGENCRVDLLPPAFMWTALPGQVLHAFPILMNRHI